MITVKIKRYHDSSYHTKMIVHEAFFAIRLSIQKVNNGHKGPFTAIFL